MARRSSRSSLPAAETRPTGSENNGAGGVSDLHVKRFANIFGGYSKAYGTFETKKADESGKVVGSAKTVRGTPTLEVYSSHLAGTGAGLGIIPLQDDDTVCFGAIDYDVKTCDHVKAEAAVKRHGLPLVVCRSKSGGAHFYAFTSEPIPASLMRKRLAEWTARLGMGAKTEMFPKQSARFNDNDIGSWINLPYYGALHTVRYAVIDGEPASLEQFLSYVESIRVSLGTLEVEPTNNKKSLQLFPDGPPCLQYLAAEGGFAEGTRNNGMLNVVTYLKKRNPDDWQGKVDEYNRELAQLGSAEVQGLIKSQTKKSYNYTCKQPPINSHCNRSECLGRLYGVGEGLPESKGIEIEALTRYDSSHGDEPMWGMEINGKRVMVSNSEFYSRDEFNRKCMAQANVVPIRLPPARWLAYLGDIIQTADVVPMPPDAGPTGQLVEWIETFCLQKANAQEKSEVWLGKPWRENGKIYFRLQDLFRFLDARKVKYPSVQHVSRILYDQMKAEKDEWHHKGRFVNLWVLPMPESGVDASPPPTTFTRQDDF